MSTRITHSGIFVSASLPSFGPTLGAQFFDNSCSTTERLGFKVSAVPSLRYIVHKIHKQTLSIGSSPYAVAFFGETWRSCRCGGIENAVRRRHWNGGMAEYAMRERAMKKRGGHNFETVTDSIIVL